MRKAFHFCVSVLSVGVHTTKVYLPVVITKALSRCGMLSLDQKQGLFRYNGNYVTLFLLKFH